MRKTIITTLTLCSAIFGSSADLPEGNGSQNIGTSSVETITAQPNTAVNSTVSIYSTSGVSSASHQLGGAQILSSNRDDPTEQGPNVTVG